MTCKALSDHKHIKRKKIYGKSLNNVKTHNVYTIHQFSQSSDLLDDL